MPLKVRDILKILQADGWYKVSQEGSHRQFKRPVKKGRVTVSGHPSDIPPRKTEKSIFEQAGLPRP